MIEMDISIWKNFSQLGTTEKVARETIIKHSGKKDIYYTFLINGIGGNHIWNRNNFICTDLSFSGQPIMDYVSFSLQKATASEIRVFEDSAIFKIHYDIFQQVFKKGNYGELITRHAIESAYFYKCELQIELLTKTAKQRYIALLDNNKKLSEVPLKYLASYLGITPQSLSRIRSEKLS